MASLVSSYRELKITESWPISARRKILIVEDETLIAMDIQGRLENAGYEVPGIAASADMARKLAGSCSPDLILMDIRLQGGSDGIAAATAVREQLDIPVIFLTSHSDLETLERAKTSEPFGYVVKPFGSTNFRAIIEIALQKHATESSLRKSLDWHNGHEKNRLIRLLNGLNPEADARVSDSADWSTGNMAFGKALLQAFPVAAAVVGQEGTILLVNAPAGNLFGYDPEELRGTSIRVLLPEHAGDAGSEVGRGVMEQSIRPVAGAGKHRYRHKDGREFPIEVGVGMIQSDSGQLVLMTFRDLMGQAHVETGRALMEAIVDQSDSAIISETPQGIVTSWNRGAELLYGYTAKEVVGRSASVLLAGPPVHGTVSGPGSAGSACSIHEEAVRRAKDGGLVEVSQIVSPIHDACGRLIGMSTVAMDISEHVRGEARFRGLLEASPDAVIVIERDGKIVLANAKAEKLFGYTREELLGESTEMLIPERFRGRGPAPRGSFFREPGARLTGEGQIPYCLRRDGQEFPVEVSLGPLDTKEGVLVSITIRDITERKHAEEKIRRTLQEKDVMLNEIHHRVKNNLQVVSSLLNLQGDQVRDPVARRMFTDSQNRIQSMALIHQQLYLSSNLAKIHFAAYLRTLANHLLASYAAESASFSIEVDAADTFLSLEEAIPCGLIVNELLSNSLKHSFHGRSSGEIRAGFRIKDGICALTVDDNGSPLPKNLFDNLPTTMGVRLVRALTAQLMGELHMGSDPKFRITFPAGPATRYVAGPTGDAEILPPSGRLD